ncbi:RNA methyltransferase [Lewinellaceae bacterium SD302]|nr:RNA methyltransferase [Lewinellaceae bacterium SD302]
MRKLPTHEISRLSPAEFQTAEKTSVVLILDNIRSANNVGSIFRTADAFALEHLYLCGITATPPHRDIMKTAIGAEATVNWSYEELTTKVAMLLKSQGWTILAVEQSDNPTWLQELELPANGKVALVLGNEVNGVDSEVMDICDAALEVPQFGTKHSLNVAVCTGVVCWEVTRRLRFN